MGFSVEEAEHLPFAPQEVLYTAFDSGLAQVEYRGENGQTALLRKSQGPEDNSGDFNQYPDVKTLTDSSPWPCGRRTASLIPSACPRGRTPGAGKRSSAA